MFPFGDLFISMSISRNVFSSLSSELHLCIDVCHRFVSIDIMYVNGVALNTVL